MPAYAAPAHLLALCSSDTKTKMTQEVQMKTINLREYYPTIYRRDHLISLPDAVAAALHEGKASEVAYQVRVFRNKAYYSLEWAEARGELPTSTAADPYTLLAANYEKEQLYQALASLSDKQRQRVYAHFFLGMSYGRIARLENVRECSIRESIRRALKSMEKFLQKNL